MGLIYFNEESRELIHATVANLDFTKETIEKIEAWSKELVINVESGTLSGSAYTQGSYLFSDFILSLLNKVSSIVETVEEELSNYIVADSNISVYHYLNEDILLFQLSQKVILETSINVTLSIVNLRLNNTLVEEILDELLILRKTLLDALSELEEDILEVRRKINVLQNFHIETSGLFTKSYDDLKIIMQNILILNNSVVNYDGTYTLPAGFDASWLVELKDNEKLNILEEKRVHIEFLQAEFGFDEPIASTLYMIKEGIDEKFIDLPQIERDYIWMRIIGEITYGNSYMSGFMWNNTAGNLDNYFFTTLKVLDPSMPSAIPMTLEEIFLSLGIEKMDFEKLQYHLNLQHIFSAEGNHKEYLLGDNYKSEERYKVRKSDYENVYGTITDSEFSNYWDDIILRYINKSDFTHQAITTSTHLKEGISLANLSGILNGSRRLDSQVVEELSGWRGDTTKQAFATPSIGIDDYLADLDAVNIINRMQQNEISYVQASNTYYEEILKNETNRAVEFKKNIGYEYIKSVVINDLAPNYEHNINGMIIFDKMPIYGEFSDVTISRFLTDEEKIEYIKVNYPDSYNFIESLKNDCNYLTDYASKGD